MEKDSYNDIKKFRENPSDCSNDGVHLQPNVDPDRIDAPCTTPDIADPIFIEPNAPPAEPTRNEILPDALTLTNQLTTLSCDGLKLELSGAAPYPTEVAAGVESVEVFLSDLTAISNDELYRIANFITDLQTLINADFLAAYDVADFTTFDQSLIDLLLVSVPTAQLIRQTLVSAQDAINQVATNIAISQITCGWRNRELWVTCANNANGFDISYLDLGVPDQIHVAADLFELEATADLSNDTLGQDAVDLLAAKNAALELECLVTNEAQTVTCNDQGILNESTIITWPTSWIMPSADGDGNAIPLSLSDQGAETWDSADWDDLENNTTTIPLSDLSGQEFLLVSDVGSTTRRRLITSYTIPAGDPRSAAPTLAEANAIAQQLAIAELDCFFPNRPRVVSCATPGRGNPEVSSRMSGLGLTASSYADRETMYLEMRAGDPATYGGPSYARVNQGVIGYDADGGTSDTELGFEARVWPGMFVGDTEAEAIDDALGFGAGNIECLWISPKHTCSCVGDTADTTQTGALLPPVLTDSPPSEDNDNSSIYDVADVAGEGVKINPSNSVDTNTVDRGLFLSSDYPNKAVSYSGAYEWPDLMYTCQAGLTCSFFACKISCCEPRPDERTYKANGKPNWNFLSYTPGEPSNKADHTAFNAAWQAALTGKSVSACQGTDAGNFDVADYDNCGVGAVSTSGANAIAHPGPDNGNSPGAPARFKYGGVLPWGYDWEEPVDPISDTDLGWPSTVKRCHKSTPPTVSNPYNKVTPDPWGFFHCAEGIAEGFTPFGLSERAQQAAIARLDCTHIAWPRWVTACPEASQISYSGLFAIDMKTEGSSTQEANALAEAILLSQLDCRDSGSMRVQFDAPGGGGGGGNISVSGLTAVAVGDQSCLPLGTNEISFVDNCDDKNPVSSTRAETGSGHVFVEAKCCAEGEAKIFILHIVADALDAATLRAANQAGSTGIAEGLAELATLQAAAEGSEFWYIASFASESLGVVDGVEEYDRVVVQAHHGPIIVTNSCCSKASVSLPFAVTMTDDGADPPVQSLAIAAGRYQEGLSGEWVDVQALPATAGTHAYFVVTQDSDYVVTGVSLSVESAALDPVEEAGGVITSNVLLAEINAEGVLEQYTHGNFTLTIWQNDGEIVRWAETKLGNVPPPPPIP